MIVTGVKSWPEYRTYRRDPGIRREVDARHAALCGCENWAGCCPLRPELFDVTVREILAEREG